MFSENHLVHADQLSLTYPGGVHALDRLDFEIPPGQFVSIVGPSGCGKSTILRLIAGLVLPTSGTITIGKSAPNLARNDNTHLAFVFQEPTLLPWRRILANVALPLELAGQSRSTRHRAAQRVLEMVALAEFSGHFPNQLSGGMKMRASLARALVVEPQLLLLDEPFAALDDITRLRLNEELIRLWNARRWTGVFVTHNIAEAVFLSQRILVMSPRPGRIAADIAIPLDYPRNSDTRTSAEFGQLVGSVTRALQEASR